MSIGKPKCLSRITCLWLVGISPVLVSGATAPSQIGDWQPFKVPTQDGTQFWDVPSLSGPGGNIGYFLTGTGLFAGNPNSPKLDAAGLSYWALPSGKADLTGSFWSVMTPVTVTLKFKAAGLSASNGFGYYLNSDISTYKSLFTGDSALNSVATFNPNGWLGLAAQGPAAGANGSLQTYASQASLSSSYPGNEGIAVFRYINGGTTSYYVAVETSPFNLSETVGTGGNMGDFTDFVFQSTIALAVPESGSVPAVFTLLFLVGWRAFSTYRQRTLVG